MRKSRKIFAIRGSAICLIVTIVSILISHAQTPNAPQKNPGQMQYGDLSLARKEIAKSVVGSLFLDAISAKESSWVLNKAGFTARSADNDFSYLSLTLTKDDTIVGVDILECDSPKEADEHFGGPRSYGVSESFSGYGDKADKLIGPRGDQLSLRFRKGNYFVSIWNSKQNTAEKFAGYVLRAIQGQAIK